MIEIKVTNSAPNVMHDHFRKFISTDLFTCGLPVYLNVNLSSLGTLVASVGVHQSVVGSLANVNAMSCDKIMYTNIIISS